MNAIEIRNLTKKYGDRTVVDQLCLSIEQGELFGLLGVNGAGKTTIIKMLTTLIQPTEGTAVLGGFDLKKDREQIRRITNVSPQETAVAPKLTVEENLLFMAKVYGADKRTAMTKTGDMIEKFDLSEITRQKAGTLSGGWQRRLSIAMALISDPEILFLDEPTLGLDVLARRELWQVISKLKGKVTVILTTHYLEEAEALADHIAIMAKGKLKAVGTAKELMQQAKTDQFEEAFIRIAEENKV